MALTVFYSWQSDTPSAVNRNFIKESLEKAIKNLNKDINIEAPLRLDQDTKDVAGHPEIFNTILRKIDECGIFIADITSVGTTDDGNKKIPNPNVLIEYGYALKSVGSERIIMVMNEVFGSTDNLPFDLRHRRFPIRYNVDHTASPDICQQQKEQLTKNLETAILTIINSGILEKKPPPPSEFVAATPRYKKSSFLEDGKELVVLRRLNQAYNFYWKNGPQMFLRLIPKYQCQEWTHLRLMELIKIKNNPLYAFSLEDFSEREPNEFGVLILFFPPGRMEADDITQAFTSGEIWGINKSMLEPVATPEGVQYKVIPHTFENLFEKSLKSYIDFSENKLEIEPPLHFVAGMDGIKDYLITCPKDPPWRGINKFHQGICLRDEIIYEGTIENYQVNIHNTLKTFFEKVWETCSLPRPHWLE